MLKFNASSFYHAISNLQGGRYRIEERGKYDAKTAGPNAKLNPADLLAGKDSLQRLKASLETIGARVTCLAVDTLLLTFDEKGGVSVKRFSEAIADIDSRLQDEFSLVHLFVMDADKHKYFAPSEPPFGQLVADRVPIAIGDIEDAGKCLALNQGTASVFHSMRVMEVGLKALGGLLGIPYAPSWESYIRQIETKITAKHRTKGVAWKKDEPFFREILGNLQTIRIAWRNPTMHVVRRYSNSEAEEIYIAVRSFMQRLAPKLPKSKLEKMLS